MKNISFKKWLNEAFTGQPVNREDVKQLCQKIIDHQDVEMNLNVLADIYDAAYNNDKAEVLRGCLSFLEPEPKNLLGSLLYDMLKAGAVHGMLRFDHDVGMVASDWNNEVACELHGTLPLSEVFDGSVYLDGNNVSKQGAGATILTYVSPIVLRGCKESQMSVAQYARTFEDAIPASNSPVYVRLDKNTKSYRLDWKYAGFSQVKDNIINRIGTLQHDADEYRLKKQNIRIYSTGFDGDVKDEFADFIRKELSARENADKFKFINDFESAYTIKWALNTVRR